MSFVRSLILCSVGSTVPALTQPLHAQSEVQHARLGRAVSEPQHRLFPDRVTILTAPVDAPGRAGLEHLLCYAGEGIESLHPQTGKRAWPEPVSCPQEPTLLGSVDDTLLFATPFHVFAIHAERGRPAWSWGDPPTQDPGRDPESVVNLIATAVTSDAVYALRDNGDLARVDVRNGRAVWERSIRATPDSRLAAVDGNVVVVAWRNGKVTLLTLAGETGAVVGEASFDDPSPIRELRATADANVLVASSRLVQAIDPLSGTQRWQIVSDDQFVPATFCVSAGYLLISPDGRRLNCYALGDGRMVWSAALLTKDDERWVWARWDGDTVYAGSADRLFALAVDDGRARWSMPVSPAAGVPPIVFGGGVVIAEPAGPAERLRIRRLERTTGRPVDFDAADAIVTAPLSHFGGVHVADGCIAILDGRRLIRYVVE